MGKNETVIKSQFERETEEGLRKALDGIPLLILSDTARQYKETVNLVCDEYIEKGEQFKKEWALKIVKDMFGNEQDLQPGEE